MSTKPEESVNRSDDRPVCAESRLAHIPRCIILATPVMC